jgi:hypothetical protein
MVRAWRPAIFRTLASPGPPFPSGEHSYLTAPPIGLAFLGAQEEDDMPTTLNPTCPLCGLRFTFGPLLELHIRDDHRQRGGAAEPDRDDDGAAPPTHARDRAEGGR